MRSNRGTPPSPRGRRLFLLDLTALLVLAALTLSLATLGRTNQARIDTVEMKGVDAAVFTDLGTFLERQHGLFIRFGSAPSDTARDTFTAELLATQQLAERHGLPKFRQAALRTAAAVAGPYRDYALAALRAMSQRLGGASGAVAAAAEVEDRYRELREELSRRRIAAEDAATQAVLALERSGRLVRGLAPLIAALAAALLVLIAFRTRRAMRRTARLEAEQALREDRERILRAALEEQREATQAAAEVARVREHLVATVSHEFRSPLTSMLGWAQTMRCRSDALSAHHVEEFADVIERQARRLSGLVENVLALSGMSADAEPSREPPTPVGRIVASLVREFSLRGTHRFDAQTEGDPYVAVDVGKLERVLTNLLDNACKYAPRGSIVHVRSGNMTGGVFVSVEDQGPGIPPGSTARIFEPFWRAAGQTESGTGLGLAIVRNLVEAMDGRVEVASPPGRGARFTIVVPAASLDAQEDESRTGRPTSVQ